MQRQSLGSPSPSKHHLPFSSSSSSLSSNNNGGEQEQDDTEFKKLKQLKPNSTKPENYIHIIPMLTLLCFLILYLFSHSPSQTDLAQFPRFKINSRNTGDLSDSISELDGVTSGIKRGDILSIRSLKNVRKDGMEHRKLHRKFAGL